MDFDHDRIAEAIRRAREAAIQTLTGYVTVDNQRMADGTWTCTVVNPRNGRKIMGQGPTELIACLNAYETARRKPADRP